MRIGSFTSRSFSALMVQFTGAFGVLLGLLVMIGWWVNSSLLKSVISGLPPMKFNTAVCFVLIGSAVALKSISPSSRYEGLARRAGQVAAIAVIAVSGLTLTEYLFQLNLRIDQFLVAEVSADIHPGRMVLVTALVFLCMGISMALVGAAHSIGQLTSQTAAVAANLLGLWGVLDIALEPFKSFTGMAAHTAVGLWVISFGVLSFGAGTGFLQTLKSDTAGGHVARRLIPAAIGIPLIIGLLRWNSETLVGAEIRTSVMVLVSTILLVVAAFWTSSGLDRLDRARRITEAKFRGLLESSPDPMIVVDGRGIIVVANAQMETVFGYSREELLGNPVGMLVPERLSEAHAARIREFFLEPAVRCIGQQGNLTARRKDGSEFPVEISLGPFDSDEGILVSCEVRDISDRLGLRESLRSNERRLNMALTAGQMGVWELDMRTGFCWRTVEHERIFGYEELLPEWEFSRFQQHIHPEDRAASELAFTEAYRTGHLLVNCRIIRVDQAVRWVRIAGEVVYDEHQTPLRMQGVIHDITDQKAAVEELRAAEERYRLLTEQVHDYAIFMLDPAGRVASWNKGAERQRGFTAAEIIGRDLSVFYPKKERAENKHLQLLEAATRDSEVVNEGWRERKDGTLIWTRVVITALRDANGVLLGYSDCAQDLTAKKKAEDALRRSNAELLQFVYVASHDLQEPLRMVASFTQLLAQRYKSKLDKDADEFIAYAVDGAQRMQRLIDDLLAYSRVGTRAKDPTICSANDLVQAALHQLTLAVKENGATIRIAPLPKICCDDVQMVSVFQNLIGNAIKFRAAGVLPLIEIGATECGSEWIFSIKDNGIGIEPRHFKRVFQVFQRLQTRETYPGNGIGLAICKKIVERHGGRIWVESEPGRGTTFYFTVPCMTGSQPEEEARDLAYTSSVG